MRIKITLLENCNTCNSKKNVFKTFNFLKAHLLLQQKLVLFLLSDIFEKIHEIKQSLKDSIVLSKSSAYEKWDLLSISIYLKITITVYHAAKVLCNHKEHQNYMYSKLEICKVNVYCFLWPSLNDTSIISAFGNEELSNSKYILVSLLRFILSTSLASL